jgi:hypothetical protein
MLFLGKEDRKTTCIHLYLDIKLGKNTLKNQVVMGVDEITLYKYLFTSRHSAMIILGKMIHICSHKMEYLLVNINLKRNTLGKAALICSLNDQ